MNGLCGTTVLGKRFAWAVCMLCILPSAAFAETIILKSGKTISGRIIEQTDSYVRMDVQGMPITYYLNEISSVEADNAPASQTENTQTPDSLIMQAGAAEMAGDADKAITLYTEALTVDKNNRTALLGLARLYTAKKDHERAIQILKQLLEQNKTDPVILRLLGLAYRSAGNVDAALECYESITEMKPKDPTVYPAMINLLYQKNDLAKAQQYLERLQALDPKIAGELARKYNLR